MSITPTATLRASLEKHNETFETLLKLIPAQYYFVNEMVADLEVAHSEVDEADVELKAMPEAGGIEVLRGKLHAKIAHLRRPMHGEAGDKDDLLEERRQQRAAMRERRRKETKEKKRKEEEVKVKKMKGKEKDRRQTGSVAKVCLFFTKSTCLSF